MNIVGGFLKKLHMKSCAWIFIDFVCVVLIWRAVWWFADAIFGSSLIANILSAGVGLLILLLDDSSLKELE